MPMSNSEARKREERRRNHWTHPDPEVRRLIADAYRRGKADGINEGLAQAARQRASRSW